MTIEIRPPVDELVRGRRAAADSSILGRADAFFGWTPGPRCTQAF